MAGVFLASYAEALWARHAFLPKEVSAFSQSPAGIESVHCHVIKKKSKTIQWIKSKSCDIIDDK